MLRAVLVLLACALAGPTVAPRGQDLDPRAPVVLEATIPLHDGHVHLAELTTGLLDAYGFDSSAVRVPDRRIDLRGTAGHLKLLACRKLLLDTVRFRRSLADDTLVVVVDRERARALRRGLRARIVRLFGDDLAERTYALDLPPDLDASRRLVVLVHGVESSPDVWDDLRAFLAAREHPPQVATFGYPNDEACERDAAELSAALRTLGAQPVALIAHSMGGLIARAVVEDPALDPGNVQMLVMLGTPNHGSHLAGLRFALEAAHLLRREDGDAAFARALLDGLRESLLDGLGEAGGDLLPDSVFLTRLNRRERNPDIEYHLVAGTRSVIRADRLAAVRARVVELAERSRALRVATPKLDAWLADLDELVDGRGDGAVSVARSALDGAEIELVPLDHVGLVRAEGLLGGPPEGRDHPVFDRVARWVGAAEGARQRP